MTQHMLSALDVVADIAEDSARWEPRVPSGGIARTKAIWRTEVLGLGGWGAEVLEVGSGMQEESQINITVR